MKKWIVCLAVSHSFIVTSAYCDEPDKVDVNVVEQVTFDIPKDPQATVISLNFQGGFTTPRIGNKPTMSILADGTVVMPKNFQGQKEFKGKITMGDLQRILDFIINKNDFLNYDPKVVKAKQDKAQEGLGFRIAVADAATTVITLNVNGKTKQVSHYALGFGGNNNVKELDQLAAVQKKLQKVMWVIQVGGKEEVIKWLKKSNEELAKQFPKVKPLTAREFQSGSQRADGSRYFQFTRNIPGPDGKAATTTLTSVTINIPAGGEPKFTVTHREPGKS